MSAIEPVDVRLAIAKARAADQAEIARLTAALESQDFTLQRKDGQLQEAMAEIASLRQALAASSSASQE